MKSQRKPKWPRIAVVGMSGRFPGARDTAQFWQNLCNGVEAITFFSEEELLAAGVDASELEKPSYVRAGCPIEGIDLFDAPFFGINPREAESMDPQQRIFLECAWNALEDAGYDPATYSGSIGVYAGCAMSSYLYELQRYPYFIELVGRLQVVIGNDKDYLTTHASYKLDLKGPSISIQTTCSTSLVAVSLACNGLQARDCDMALAGGICIRLPQKVGYHYEPGGIFSHDGHCRVFDAKANGVVFGNGVGIVVLKRLADALRDGDAIYAVILGSAVNNDGCVKASYTAPGLEGQAEVVIKAHRAAGTPSRSISYVEAHGTGTILGDPIEIAALTRGFRLGRHRKGGWCAIGSVKTNVGHLDHAAGVTGLIKTALSLKNKLLPPSLNCDHPNPHIAIEKSPFYVNTRLTEWKTDKLPRRAGVSAFGIGGTNVHVVLEEAPAVEGSSFFRPAQLLVLSARTSTALDVATSSLAEHLKCHPEINLADVAYTCQIGRRAFNCRRAVVSETINDAVEALGSLDPKRVLAAALEPHSKSIVFMFSGQGTQYVNMGQQLYRTETTFRNHVDYCSELMKGDLGLNLRELLYPGSQEREAGVQLAQTWITQPALFVIEYSLAQLLMEWGIRPHAMIGHSIGEYVAACIAGCFSLDQALRIVVERGRLMQQAPSGSMLSIPLPEKEARSLLPKDLDIAAMNQESMCVAAGPTVRVKALEDRLARKRVVCHRLRTSHAFHSRMMNSAMEPFRHFLNGIEFKPPQIPFVSNVTGSWISASCACSPDYWAKHLREPVRFAEGIRTLLESHNGPFLELGPGHTLASFVQQHPDKRADQAVLSTLRHRQFQETDTKFLLNTVAKLWVQGVEVDWAGFHNHERLHRLHLPTYPFERKRYWVSSPTSCATDAAEAVLERGDLANWFYVPSWECGASGEAFHRDLAEAQSWWLVFQDEHGLGSEMASCIREQGKRVVTVRMGRRFAALEGSYEIDPREKEHYRALLKDLRSRNQLPLWIAHLWTLCGNGEPHMQKTDDQQHLGFYSLLFLTQALIAESTNESVRIAFISNQVHFVTGEEQLCPGKAMALAVCKSVPQEYPNFRCRAIDIELPMATQSFRDSAEQLLIEIDSEPSTTMVAYRNGQRWVQVFERTPLPPADTETGLLKECGTYLITGGLGNMGLTIAEELTKAVRARVVLVGRSGLPAREEWEQWLERNGDVGPVSTKIRRISAIEELGGKVMILRADVSKEREVREAIDQVYARWGCLHGIIHGAGNVSSEGFFAVDIADRSLCERQFASKVHGLLNLECVLRGERLDFWVLLSSISSVLAGLGYVAYSAANIFLDSFASERTAATGIPWVSINWDTWDFSESQKANSHAAILPKEGAEALQRILRWSPLPQIVVSTTDLETRLDQWIRLSPSQSSTKGRVSHGSHVRPALGVPYVAPRDDIERTITDIWEELLGISEIGIHDNFFSDLSGSSLLATQLVARLRANCNADFPLRRFFETPTIAELAVAVQRREKVCHHTTEEQSKR